MNYKIITDEKLLKEFINDFLPSLSKDETFYCGLFGRSKYCKDIVHINSDKEQLKRFTSDKDRLFEKIKQCECPLGFYSQKGVVMPQEALAIYINPNPRSNVKAAKNALIRLAHLVTGENYGYSLHQEMISEVQKAKGKKHFVDFDFDNVKVEEIFTYDYNLYNYINSDAASILETRGGFHILVESKKVDNRFIDTWFIKIKAMQIALSSDKIFENAEEGDNVFDNMIPIPGTYQGGFTPKFYDI